MKTKHKLNAIFELSGIFVVALFLRVVFNLSQEHRLCHFGDAFYYLTSGSQLLGALKSGMLTHLSDLHAQASLGVQTMTSVSFIDRILIDGPIFPAYLAFVQTVIGLNPDAPHFDLYSLQLAISNSLLDAIACLLIYQAARLAFNRTAALIAGLLAAFYPAAIINTASCYSEPFSYFLVSSWIPLWLSTQLRHVGKVQQSVSGFATGVCSGMLMLSKPIFVALPPLFAALTLVMNAPKIFQRARLSTTSIIAISLAGVGLLLTFAPWLFFTGTVTGKSSIVVNRYPAFNFVMGNRLESDGWRQYPQPYVPAEMKDAVQMARADFQRAPLEYSAMQVRKATRLWSGSWNNFERSFVLSPEVQDCIHQWLLLAGFAGLIIGVSRNKIGGAGLRLRAASREYKAAILLASLPLFHCIYLAFEPQARYAFSSMPCVIILAAFATSLVVRKVSPKRRLVATALIAGAAFILLHRFLPTTAQLTYPIAKDGMLLADATVWLLIWGAVSLTLWKLAQSNIGRLTVAGAWLSVSIVLLASSTFEQSRYEIPLALKPSKPIERTIQLNSDEIRNGYVLVDVTSGGADERSPCLAPPVVASVNSKALSAPLPWWQVSGDNSELVSALSVQAQGMGTSIYRFRQWWVFFVPKDALRTGQNKLSIALDAPDAKALVMADYPTAYDGNAAWLPSLDKASWTKGFTSIFRNEPRLYGLIETSAELANSAKHAHDPQPRLFFIAAKDSEASALPSQQQVRTSGPRSQISVRTSGPRSQISVRTSGPRSEVLLIKGEKLVAGENPLSFAVTPAPLSIPAAVNDRGGYFRLTADAHSVKRSTDAFASVTFSSTVNGKPVQWSSPWQPTHIQTDKNWSKWSFGDRIPQTVLAGQNASVTVNASPFPADLLFLNKKQALKRAIALKNVQLEFVPVALYPEPSAQIKLH